MDGVILNFSNTEFELKSNVHIFLDELFIFHIAEYCVIPEELIKHGSNNKLKVIRLRSNIFHISSRYISSSHYIKFLLFTVYQSIFKSL